MAEASSVMIPPSAREKLTGSAHGTRPRGEAAWDLARQVPRGYPLQLSVESQTDMEDLAVIKELKDMLVETRKVMLDLTFCSWL
jgi:hypothetical protein